MNISIMQSRYDSLVRSMAGYVKTGVPLVSWDGARLKPVETGDDLGLFYFVPRLAAFTHSDAHHAINIFFISIMLGALVSGMIGFALLYKSWVSRGVALLGSLWLARVGLGIGDVYVIPVALTLALVPLFLWFVRQNRFTPTFGAFLFAAGAAISTGNWIRSQAGTSLVLFMAILLLAGQTVPLKLRGALLACLVSGIVVLPLLWFKPVENNAEAYMTAHQPGHQPLVHQHVVWHSIYIGFGYLNNDDGILYKDEVAAAKVASIDPTVPYCSVAYERILKEETFKFVRGHLWFVQETLAAKLGVLLLFLVRFANIGLIAAWRSRRPAALEAAFWVAMAVGALPGLLVVPRVFYVSSFIAFAVLYAVVCINGVLEARQKPAVASS